MAITLFDLAGADDRLRFSPYCWRTKMAIKHKGLDFEAVPWRFTEKDTIEASGSHRVPVIDDGGTWIADSWAIALYLDETYPGHPLMEDEAARGLSRFVNSWCDMSVNRYLRPLALLHVLAAAHEKDRAYFRESRERMLGMTLEEACADEKAARAGLLEVLAPAEQVLSQQDYLCGSAPGYGDYALFGSLKWVHTLTGEAPLETDSAVHRWFESLLDLHDGYARSAAVARAA